MQDTGKSVSMQEINVAHASCVEELLVYYSHFELWSPAEQKLEGKQTEDRLGNYGDENNIPKWSQSVQVKCML